MACFLLYCALVIYVLENWAFYKDLEKLRIKCVKIDGDEKVRVLLTIIKTLIIEIQQLKNILAVIPIPSKNLAVRKMKSVDWGSF